MTRVQRYLVKYLNHCGLLDSAQIWYMGGLGASSVREYRTEIEIHLPCMKSKVGCCPPHFQFLNRYNSAADCSISLKFCTEFRHITADVLYTFKNQDQRSKVKVTLTV